MSQRNQRATSNLRMLEFVARKLGELNDEVVYLGGCTTALFINDPLSLDVRPTLDVDCIIDVLSLGQYYKFEEKLKEKGFHRSMQDDVTCRWHCDDIILDVMMKLAWLTDIHLNFLKVGSRQKYYESILATGCDALLISGDIAEAPSLIDILNEMAGQIKKPIYFIVGNHDYYRGSINEVRKELTALSTANANLFWLSATGLQQLPNNTILLGQDGWADGRLGDYQNSPVSLNDSRMIADLFQGKMLSRQHLLQKMQVWADLDASALKNGLTQAIKQQPQNIIVLTHVPPFKEASQHMGQVSDDNFLPYFSSKAIGDVLMPAAMENPSIDFLVLCGHTHSHAEYKPRTNLIVKVGKAEYYKPVIQEIITL